MKKYPAIAAAMILCLAFTSPAQAAVTHFHGVNLPQAGFNSGKIPGVNGRDYMWQPPADIDLFAGLGANIVRVAFLWERMQPELNGPLDAGELSRLDALVREGQKRGVTVLLDVHNYGAYHGRMIGSAEVPASAFADLWSRLAAHYRNDPGVAFGLMNEPRQNAAAWAPIAQQAVDAIRRTGAEQLILVPGTNWSSAPNWVKNGNAAALADINDPGHNFAFEMHEYFDRDSSGTHPQCVSADIGAQRLEAATAWLRQAGHRAFLGEFGASKDPVCLAALKRTLSYMAENKDVWYGWTYWAAAPWFGTYMFNIYPPDPSRFPQVDVLKQFMG